MRCILPFLALPLALAACTPTLAPEAALEAAHAAEASGDAREAVRFYRAAANAGDLEAMKTVVRAYEEGYLRARGPDAPRRQGEIVSHFMPVFVWPGQASRWRDRYERERDAAALVGDPAAWMRVAEDLTVWNRDETQADRDSALAIRRRLLAEGYGPALIQEALMTMGEDSLRADALLIEAAATGSAQACLLRLVLIHARESVDDRSAATTARHIDELEACGPLPGGQPYGGEVLIENVRRSARGGMEEARAILDSLTVLGVYERHPRLAEI